METGVFEIEFTNGRIFRIIYNNKSQKFRIINASIKLSMECKIKNINELVNGLHTVSQFETMINTKDI